MAGRSHARLLLTIWADPEWRALPHLAQWFYELLISQEALNTAGVQPLTIRRWSNLAADTREDDIRLALKTLTDTRFILVDEDTEEVLVRTFIRNDGVDKQPYMMIAALRAATQVVSPLLRAELLAELRRVDVSEMRVRKADKPIQPLYEETLAALAGGPLPPPPHPTFDTPSDTPPEQDRDPSRTPSPTPCRTPSPTPCATPTGEGEGVSSYVTSTEKDIPAAATHATTDRTRARRGGSGELVRAAELNRTAHRPQGHTLITTWAAGQPGLTTPKRRELAKAVDELLAQGANPDLIPEALDHAHTDRFRNPAKALPHAYEDIRRAHHPRPVLAATGTTGRPSTTSQRVADALSLLRPDGDDQ